MISPTDYQFLADLLKQHSGLSLGTGKDYLLESRLPPVAATHKFADLNALIAGLRSSPSPALIKSMCDAMTTGETLFFRDTAPFTVLQQTLLPEAVARARAANRSVRVWCAACSTGQEAYSVAMTIEQCRAAIGTTKIEILATDFSSPTLARAKEGIYNQFEVQRGLPVQLLVKCFRQVPQGFQIVPELRNQVTFQEGNLLKPFVTNGLFDIIFIRNVLIYFDTPTKKDVLERIVRQLNPGGVVVLGGTENTLGVTDKMVRQAGLTASVYRRQGDATPPIVAPATKVA
jgi:chemotaxis protein methyltransferase CheR